MTTVTVSNKLTEILASFGDLQESVNTAVQRYTIEQITNKITELRRKDEEFQKKYGMDYSAFAERTGEDEEFVNKVEADISKTWEADLAWLTGNSVTTGLKIGRKNFKTFCLLMRLPYYQKRHWLKIG